MIVEIAHLTIGVVGDAEGMRAWVQDTVGVADIDALAALDALAAPILRLAVALDGHDLEIHLDLAALGIGHDKREIPENAAADVSALGIDGDCLDDLHGAVTMQGNRLVETGDDLGCRRGRCAKQKAQSHEEPAKPCHHSPKG